MHCVYNMKPVKPIKKKKNLSPAIIIILCGRFQIHKDKPSAPASNTSSFIYGLPIYFLCLISTWELSPVWGSHAWKAVQLY